MLGNGLSNEEQVAILTDLDINSEPIQDIAHIVAQLIKAAKEGSIAAVVCEHADSDRTSTILCVTYPVDTENRIGYVPVAMLIAGEEAPLKNLKVPDGAKT